MTPLLIKCLKELELIHWYAKLVVLTLLSYIIVRSTVLLLASLQREDSFGKRRLRCKQRWVEGSVDRNRGHGAQQKSSNYIGGIVPVVCHARRRHKDGPRKTNSTYHPSVRPPGQLATEVAAQKNHGAGRETAVA